MSHINAGTLQKNDTLDLYSHEITDLDIVSLPCRQNQWVYSSNRVDQSNPPYFQAEPGKVLSNRGLNVSKYSSNYSYPTKEYAERYADIYCSDQKQIRIMRRDQSPSRRGSSPSPNEMIPDNNTRKQYKKVTTCPSWTKILLQLWKMIMRGRGRMWHFEYFMFKSPTEWQKIRGQVQDNIAMILKNLSCGKFR